MIQQDYNKKTTFDVPNRLLEIYTESRLSKEKIKIKLEPSSFDINFVDMEEKKNQSSENKRPNDQEVSKYLVPRSKNLKENPRLKKLSIFRRKMMSQKKILQFLMMMNL